MARKMTPQRRPKPISVWLRDVAREERFGDEHQESKGPEIASQELAEKIIETVRESMLVMDAQLRVLMANASFYHTFHVSRDETEGRLVYELGNNQWDIPELRKLLEEILPSKKTFDGYEVDHHFETIGRRVMLLNGRQIDHIQCILLAIEDVTERQQSIQRLRDSEQLFRAMVDDLPLIVWLHDAEGAEQFINRTYCKYFGLDRTELGSQHWRELLHPDETTFEWEFMECVHQRRPFHGTVRVRRADGTWRWLESWGRPRLDMQGEYLGYIGCSADITERKKAEEEILMLNATLEDRVAQRTSALGTLHDIAAVANEATTVEDAILYALQRVSVQIGWSCGYAWLADPDRPDTLVPEYAWCEDAASSGLDRLRERIASVDLQADENLIARVFTSGKAELSHDVAAQVSVQHLPMADVCRIQTVGAFPIRAAAKVVGVLEFYAEKHLDWSRQLHNVMTSVGTLLGRVIEREHARTALRNSEARLRAILDAAPDANISVDRSGVIVDVNPAAEQLFGYTADEMLGQDVGLLMPSPYCEEHEGYIARYLETREPRIIGRGRELNAKAKDGRVFSIDLAVNEVKNQSLFVGIIRDISQRKELERQVVEAAADEQRRIGQDIHDGVGQELTGLRYMAQTHAESLSEQGSPHANTASRIAEWLETVQQQLRTTIRELVPVEVDQQGLVAALRGLAERTAQIHQLDCVLECSQEIRVADAALGTHLYRIGQEAVRNAVRHAHARRIVIGLSEVDGKLKLQVTDDGIGMASTCDRSDGIGLRTMEYRASLIGAALEILTREGGGTQIICTMSRSSQPRRER